MSILTAPKTNVKVADEVWIVTALLHQEQPDHADFLVEEIVDRAQREGIERPLRPGVYVHVIQHCVANHPPNPGRYRILLETAGKRRRLFRKGDPYHSAREGSKITPAPEDIPAAYRHLLDWYRGWSASEAESARQGDPLLSLVGSGKGLWSEEHADDYVRRLREGWE